MRPAESEKKWGAPRPPDAPLGTQEPWKVPVDTPQEWLQWLISRLELDMPELIPGDIYNQFGNGPDWRPWGNFPLSVNHDTWAKFPGGVRVLAASDYNDLGADVSAQFDNYVETPNYVRYTIDHNAGPTAYSGAPTVITIPTSTLDLDLTDDNPTNFCRRYNIWFRARFNTATVMDTNLHWAVVNDDPDWPVAVYGSFAGAGVDLPTDEAMGMYCRAQVAITQANRNLEIRLWRNGEVDCEIEIDLIYMFPLGDMKDTYLLTTDIVAGQVFDPGGGYYGLTASSPGSTGAYDNSKNGIVSSGDTQAIKHLLSGQMNWSFYDFAGHANSPFYDLKAGGTSAFYRAQAYTPYHAYICARVLDDFQEGYVTLGKLSQPVATAALTNKAGWHWYYLGIVEPFFNTVELACWVPSIGGGGAASDVPFPFADPGSEVLVSNGYWCNALLDYQTGGRS